MSSRSSVDRALAQCSGGHGLESCRGLRFFFVPRLCHVMSPSQGACDYLIFLTRRFHRSIYFYFEYISNSDPHRNLSNQLQSQARTAVALST